MATTNENIDINVNSSQALQSLRSIERSVDLLANGFREFMTGVAEGMAGALASTNKAKAGIDGMKRSMDGLNGKNGIDNVRNSVDKLNASVAKTNISKTIGEQAAKANASVGQLSNAIEGARNKFINFENLVGGFVLGNLIQSSYQAASEMRGLNEANMNAGFAVDSLARNMDNLRTALIQQLEPLNKMIAQVNVSVDAFKKLFDIILLVGSFFVGGLLARGVLFITGGIARLGVAVGELIHKFTRLTGTIRGSEGIISRTFQRQGAFKFFDDIGSVLIRTFQNMATILSAPVASLQAIVPMFANVRTVIIALASAVTGVAYNFSDFFSRVISGQGALTDFERLLHFGLISPLKTIGDLLGMVGRGLDNIASKAEQHPILALTKMLPSLDLEKVKNFFSIRTDANPKKASPTFGPFMGRVYGPDYHQKLAQEEQRKGLEAIEKRQKAIAAAEKLRAERAALHLKNAQSLAVEIELQEEAYLAIGERFRELRDLKKSIMDEAFNRDLQNNAQAIDDAASRYQLLADIMKQFSTVSVSPLLEAQRRFADAFGDTGDGMTPERMAEMQRGLDAISRAYAENKSYSISWEKGWKDAFQNFIDQTINMADVARSVFESIVGNMERTLDNFVQTGKLNFKELVGSIIKDLTSMALKQAFRNLLMMTGGGGGSGGWLSSIGSWFAGFFAKGGYIPPGKAGIVGEAGPELIGGPATVTPMDKANLGGGSVTNNYYISAIDSQSVAQFFAKHQRTMLGTIRQAERGIPGGARAMRGA